MQKFENGSKAKWLRFDPPIVVTIKSALTADRGDGVQRTKYIIEDDKGELQSNIREADLCH